MHYMNPAINDIAVNEHIIVTSDSVIFVLRVSFMARVVHFQCVSKSEIVIMLPVSGSVTYLCSPGRDSSHAYQHPSQELQVEIMTGLMELSLPSITGCHRTKGQQLFHKEMHKGQLLWKKAVKCTICTIFMIK